MTVPDEPVPPRLTDRLTTLDLKDKKAARVVQLLFVLGALAFAAAAILLDLQLASGWGTGVSIVVSVVACLSYMWAHEATHGVLLTAFSGQPSRYAVRFPYLTTGNDAFVSRRAFVVIALGPLLLWGVVLLGLVAVVPADARLTVYILCALNVAGSAGDLYQVWLAARLPGDALLRDDGNETTVMVR